MREFLVILSNWFPLVFLLEVALQFCLGILPTYLRGGRVRLLDSFELSGGAFLAFFCVLLWKRNWSPMAAPLALAVLARLFAPAMVRDPRAWAGLVVCTACFLFGLRWGLQRTPPSRLLRFGLVFIGFLLPLLVAQLLTGGLRFRGPWILWQWAAVTVFGATIALSRSTRPPSIAYSGRRALTWASLALLAGISFAPARDTLRQMRRAEVQRALAEIEPALDAVSYRTDWFHRGVNFTANGYPYDSQQARDLLRKLPAYGIREIALVPYGFIDRQSGRLRFGGADSWENDDGVRLLTAEAHRLGMKVLLKPHVWRPRQQDLSTSDQRLKWLAGYEKFLLHYADLAMRSQADLFCVGVELAALSGEEAEWRRLIALARGRYGGPLVYAATQGPEFESIRFWDALDYIGLDNYYPLGANYDTSDMLTRIEAVQRRFGKPVLLTEAGYSSSPDAHLTPWDDRHSGPVSLDEQVRSYEALYSALQSKPWFRGIYWWKIETDETGGPDHPGMAPWGKPAMAVIRSWNARRHVSETGGSTPAAPAASEKERAQP